MGIKEKAKREQIKIQNQINDATVKWLNSVISIADWYDCERNEIVAFAAGVLTAMVEMCDFKNYNPNDSNREG